MNQNIIVTESSKNIRAVAREALQGKWKIAVMAMAVYMLAVMVPTAILNLILDGTLGSTLGGIYSLIVTGAFSFGISAFFLQLTRNQQPLEVGTVFCGFERLFKTLGLMVVMSVFIFLWTLLFIIPGIIAAYRYSMAYYVLVDNPEMGIMECLAESKRIMTGNKIKLFCLEFSFIGWTLLGVIITGIIQTPFIFISDSGLMSTIGTIVGEIPFFWISTYIFTACTVFYDMACGRLVAEKEIDVEPINVTYEKVEDAPAGENNTEE